MQHRPRHGGSTHRQQEQQTAAGISQSSHGYQNIRKRPHSPTSVMTTPSDEEFDAIGSAALSNYELSQHPNTSMTTAVQQRQVFHSPDSAQQPSANFPAPAALDYNPYTAKSGSSGGTAQVQSVTSGNPELTTQIENMNFRLMGEVKTLRDRISQEERGRKEAEQKLESHRLELAAKEEEWRKKFEKQSTQLMFYHKELADEREKYKSLGERSSLTGGVSPAEQVMHVPSQVAKMKRPRQPYSPANTSPSAFPSTATFMESPRLVASTPLQHKQTRKMHPSPLYVDSKRAVTTEAQSVTPNPSPLLAARAVDKSVQTPSQSSSSLLSLSANSSVQVSLGRTFIVPHSEGDALMMDDIQSDGRLSDLELLQRLVQSDRQESKVAMDSSVGSHNKLSLLSEDEVLSPCTEDEEDSEEGDTLNTPPARPDGFFSLMTCFNPFFIASTSKPIDTIVSLQHSTSSSSKKGKATVKENSSLVKAAILQSIGQKRRLAASEDSEGSSSDDSGPSKSSPSGGNMSPLLLDSASQHQLQECVARLLASAGVPHSTPLELCTPLQFAKHHSARSTAQLRGEEDQGLSLLYFLQERIIAYYRECSSDSSLQGDNGDSPFTSPESTADSLAGSDRGIGSASLSFEGVVVDFCAPLLQLLKILLALVRYSPRVRQKMCERPPRLVYDSLIPSRPGSRSGQTDSQSDLCSSESQDGSMELLGQKSSPDLSDQSSGKIDSSGSQGQLSQLALDLSQQDHVWMPHTSLSKVHIDPSSQSSGTTSSSSSSQPSFSLLEQEVSIDVMRHATLSAQFFPLLLRLVGPPWSDNLPICQCVLDILSHLVPACTSDLHHRLLPLLSDGIFAACLKHDSCEVACTVARITTALVPTKGVAEVLCSKKSSSCLLYKLYMFLCDPPNDTSDVSIAELTSQVLKLMCAVLSHIDGGLHLIFYSEECDCTVEALGAVLRGVCHHLPIKNGAQVSQPVITCFQELISFLDCYSCLLDNGDVNYIFAIENLLEFFSGLGKDYMREVTALKSLQQDMEQHDDKEEQEEEENMDTQSL